MARGIKTDRSLSLWKRTATTISPYTATNSLSLVTSSDVTFGANSSTAINFNDATHINLGGHDNFSENTVIGAFNELKVAWERSYTYQQTTLDTTSSYFSLVCDLDSLDYLEVGTTDCYFLDLKVTAHIVANTILVIGNCLP